jgi:hypothetical protein
MTRFNFKEACLLDASGELGDAARRALYAYLRENPAACLEYEEIRKEFEVLGGVPAAAVTARQRREVPARLKQKLHQTFDRRARAKRAAARAELIRHALTGVAAAAAAAVVVLSITLPQLSAARARDRQQVARINATVDRLAAWGSRPASAYEQAVSDVEASLRQLQTESPALAEVHDKNMGNLLNALAVVTADVDDFILADPPEPPGSL